jgi:hypothetical protein
MKYLNIIIVFLVLISCKKNSDIENENLQKNNTLINTEKESKVKNIDSLTISESIKTDSLNFDINEISNDYLVGMELSENIKEKNPYKKYSLDVSGACYSCDLATFKLEKDKILINNYCEPEGVKEVYKISKIKTTKHKIEFICDRMKFIFYKVDNVSVYSLKIEGDFKTKLKIDKYFTKQSLLKNFEVHDCGDFEG